MIRYSDSFKRKVRARIVGARTETMDALAEKFGVSVGTLWKWRREAMLAGVTDSKKATPKRPQDWTLDEKLRFLMEASQVAEEDLGAFLRERGVHEDSLIEWRNAVTEALETPAQRGRKQKAESKRVRQLERELARKDKALAEAAALLVLKKKVQAIWGDEEDDTNEESEK